MVGIPVAASRHKAVTLFFSRETDTGTSVWETGVEAPSKATMLEIEDISSMVECV
jgi:hypothetical protein